VDPQVAKRLLAEAQRLMAKAAELDPQVSTTVDELDIAQQHRFALGRNGPGTR
jgi:hypothetical protein